MLTLYAPIGLFTLPFAPLPPIHIVSGKGLPITEQLRPLIASQAPFAVRSESPPPVVPIITGTGSETTGVAIVDITSKGYRQPCNEPRSRDRQYIKHPYRRAHHPARNPLSNTDRC